MPKVTPETVILCLYCCWRESQALASERVTFLRKGTWWGSWRPRGHPSWRWERGKRWADCLGLDLGKLRRVRALDSGQRLFDLHSQTKPGIERPLKYFWSMGILNLHNWELVVRMLKESWHWNMIAGSFHRQCRDDRDRNMLTFGNCIWSNIQS